MRRKGSLCRITALLSDITLLALYSAIGGETETGKGGAVDTGALAEERDPLQRHPDKSYMATIVLN